MDCNWILIWFKVQVVAKPWVLLEPADGPTKPPSHPIQTWSSAVQRPEFRVWYLLINSRMNQCLQPSGLCYTTQICARGSKHVSELGGDSQIILSLFQPSKRPQREVKPAGRCWRQLLQCVWLWPGSNCWNQLLSPSTRDGCWISTSRLSKWSELGLLTTQHIERFFPLQNNTFPCRALAFAAFERQKKKKKKR